MPAQRAATAAAAAAAARPTVLPIASALGAGAGGHDARTPAARYRPRDKYVANEELTRRARIWRLFDDPASSREAKALAIAIMVVILFSGILFVLETVPDINDSVDDAVWESFELGCIVLFTSEYAIRLLSCPDRRAFLRDSMNFIDLIAILPFYVEKVFVGKSSGSSAVFRIMRLVRVFRVFKISRYMHWIRVFSATIVESMYPLGMLLYIMMIAMVLFSSAMYYAERGVLDGGSGAWLRDDGSPAPINSILAASWWCIITLTTVGYGDVVPVTSWGRLIAGITSLAGILVLAIPITVISANFNNELDKMMRRKKLDLNQISALKEELMISFYKRDKLEQLILSRLELERMKPTPTAPVELEQLEACEMEISESQEKLCSFVEDQIALILQTSMQTLMQQIGELIQKQKISTGIQVQTVLVQIPTFVLEESPLAGIMEELSLPLPVFSSRTRPAAGQTIAQPITIRPDAPPTKDAEGRQPTAKDTTPGEDHFRLPSAPDRNADD